APVVAEIKPEPKPEPSPAPVVAEAKPEPVPATEEKRRKFKPAPAMAANNEEKKMTEHITPPQRKKSSSGRNSLTWLGFQVSATGSRVFIKTTDEAEYSIKEKDDRTLVLEIYNTDIPKKNNRRPLDTSFFNSPVAYISPQVESGSIKVVRIEIRLKQRVPFIAKQESNALYLDFEGVN
ncbi:MAG: AMIN domain-containing protein, partial [Myxococcota bacterium]